MPQAAQKRSRKAGLPPGTPVYLGERKSEATRLTLLHYDEQNVAEKEIRAVEECWASRDMPGVTWINITVCTKWSVWRSSATPCACTRWFWKTSSTPISVRSRRTTAITSTSC